MVKTKEEEVEEVEQIVMGDPQDLRPIALPLVVKVPESASSAQKEYAKILNGYAYKNPTKWAIKKQKFLERLESLKEQEVLVDENRKLSLNKSTVSFSFPMIDGKETYVPMQ